jgi:hypothetical protein
VPSPGSRLRRGRNSPWRRMGTSLSQALPGRDPIRIPRMPPGPATPRVALTRCRTSSALPPAAGWLVGLSVFRGRNGVSAGMPRSARIRITRDPPGVHRCCGRSAAWAHSARRSRPVRQAVHNGCPQLVSPDPSLAPPPLAFRHGAARPTWPVTTIPPFGVDPPFPPCAEHRTHPKERFTETGGTSQGGCPSGCRGTRENTGRRHTANSPRTP